MSGDGTDDVSFKLVHRKIVVTLLSTLAARNFTLIAHTNDITYQVAIFGNTCVVWLNVIKYLISRP